MRVEK
jgi:hypothetical protein